MITSLISENLLKNLSFEITKDNVHFQRYTFESTKLQKIVANQTNIVVDVGNSFIKSAKFSGNDLMEKNIWNELQDLKEYYRSSASDWIFSSVRRKQEEISEVFATVDYILMSHETAVPITLDYETPETLGMDRLAAAVGAFHQFPDKTSLVIDAGSCITYDVVDAGIYRGGVIAPGLKMRMKAMNHFTGRLPDISSEWESLHFRSPGKTTKECMANGAYVGMAHEINGFIEAYMKDYKDLAVILTGGDAAHFESKLKAPIFADFNLVLIGLNRILNHNK